MVGGLGGRVSIVVVDDDDDMQQSVRELLEGEGYTVESAANGSEALERLRHMPAPGMVLLDLAMPVMNGWELVTILSHDQSLATIPVLIISSSEDPPTEGVVGVMTKPVDTDNLLATVNSLCRGRAMAPERLQS